MSIRGVHQQPSGLWTIRFSCGRGHQHRLQIGRLKSDAVDAYQARRLRARTDPSWCPTQERRRRRAQEAAAAAQDARRITIRAYVDDYARWAGPHKRGWRKNERFTAERWVAMLGADTILQDLTTAQLEAALDRRTADLSGATRNRYLYCASSLFKRAVRLGLLATNPMTGIPRVPEHGRRLLYLDTLGEAVIRDALPARLRAAFSVAVHTGLRFSEQASLTWRDIDVVLNQLTVDATKNNHPRRVPLSPAARSALIDLASTRPTTGDSADQLFPLSYRQTQILFARAVARAQDGLREAGQDPRRLEGVTWHVCRHTFASRLVMLGVDLRTVQELGGWRTLAMVQRYAHLSPGHLQAAVDRLSQQALDRLFAADSLRTPTEQENLTPR